MKKIWISIIWGLLFMSVLIACMEKSKEKQTVPQYVFSYAENQAEDYPTTLGARRFAELVAEKTGGRIKILVEAEGRLGDEKSVVKQLRFGGIDFARISLSQLAEIIPEYNVLQMPYLYKDAGHMWKVLESSIGSEFLDKAEAYDMVGMSWYDAGARSFYDSVKEIHTPKDMQGMKIRVQESALMEDMVAALGAIPVPIVYDDVYSSLERGLIDGAENNWPSYESTGHDQVAKYFTVDEHTRVPEMQLCSKTTWKQLTKSDQKIIISCARESALYERSLWIEREKQAEKAAVKEGVKVIKLTAKEKAAFQRSVESVYQKYCAEDQAVIDKIREMGE